MFAYLGLQINIMSTRMRSNKHRGRSIVNDTAIHNLFSQLTELHTNVLDRMNKLESDRGFIFQLILTFFLL